MLCSRKYFYVASSDNINPGDRLNIMFSIVDVTPHIQDVSCVDQVLVFSI